MLRKCDKFYFIRVNIIIIIRVLLTLSAVIYNYLKRVEKDIWNFQRMYFYSLRICISYTFTLWKYLVYYTTVQSSLNSVVNFSVIFCILQDLEYYSCVTNFKIMFYCLNITLYTVSIRTSLSVFIPKKCLSLK